LTLLMIVLALAIDIGALQGERRHMQNAADAAALEAARARCFDPGVTTGAQAAALGQQFAVDNYSNRAMAASETFTVTARANNDWEFDAYATELVNLSLQASSAMASRLYRRTPRPPAVRRLKCADSFRWPSGRTSGTVSKTCVARSSTSGRRSWTTPTPAAADAHPAQLHRALRLHQGLRRSRR